MTRYISCMDCELLYRKLLPVERAVIAMREEDPPRIYAEIGELTGHTAAQARQFHRKAVHKLGLSVIGKVYGNRDET